MEDRSKKSIITPGHHSKTFVPDNPDAILPDKRFDPDWNAYSQGRDSAIDWIVAH